MTNTENTENFDYSTLFDFVEEQMPIEVIEVKKEKEKLSASSEALLRLKKSKERDKRYSKKSNYSSRYEKALITIFEKDNGEI